MKKAINDHAERIDDLTDDLKAHAKVIDQLTEEFDEVNNKYEKMNGANKILHQMIRELHETSSNENKALRQEIEALRVDKAVKDEKLNMLYIVIEHQLGINVQAMFNDLEIQKVEERRAERENSCLKKLSKRRKVNAEEVNMDVENEADPEQSFVLIGESFSIPYSLKEVIRLVKVDQRKRKARKSQGDFDPKYGYDDDDDQGATGLLVKPSNEVSFDDYLNDQLNEQSEDQHQEASSSGKQHAGDQVFLTQPNVIYLHASFNGELEDIRSMESMLEELGLEDEKLKFDIEEEIPSSLEKEYSFNFANEADNFNDVIIEEGSDISDEDTPFHYSGVDDTFPTFAEMFKSHNEEEVRRKVVERISTNGVPEDVPREELLEGRKNWFKYFEFLSDIKTLPWWDVEELAQTKNIKQFYYGPDVKIHDEKLWRYIKLQAKEKFLDWKLHYPKQIVNIDAATGEKDITLKIKPPRCLKNMPLRAMEQDFHEDFKGWMYNQSTTEAVI
ncbi:hypothetical protein Hanom_Chr05g00401961 [Helianthus anomalus]